MRPTVRNGFRWNLWPTDIDTTCTSTPTSISIGSIRCSPLRQIQIGMKYLLVNITHMLTQPLEKMLTTVQWEHHTTQRFQSYTTKCVDHLAKLTILKSIFLMNLYIANWPLFKYQARSIVWVTLFNQYIERILKFKTNFEEKERKYEFHVTVLKVFSLSPDGLTLRDQRLIQLFNRLFLSLFGGVQIGQETIPDASAKSQVRHSGCCWNDGEINGVGDRPEDTAARKGFWYPFLDFFHDLIRRQTLQTAHVREKECEVDGENL